ncbi:XamI family restriction endonuclease [soil metagenome]
MSQPAPCWTEKQLAAEAPTSAAAFRTERLAPTEAWRQHIRKSRERFAALFRELGALAPGAISDEALASAYQLNLGEALRYLSGPPISDDDLKVLADVPSLAPSVLVRDKTKLRRVFSIIERTIDPYRFPWVLEQRKPTRNEKAAALLASSVLLAAQRISTARRGYGKATQEALLREFLVSLKYKEVRPIAVTTIVEGPQLGEFCGEAKLGHRKADVILRLNDTRLMPIECKVSNSALNSVKRINNDAAAKAAEWLKAFGTTQVVPTAVISGVFKVSNLMQAQEAGLALFWALT